MELAGLSALLCTIMGDPPGFNPPGFNIEIEDNEIFDYRMGPSLLNQDGKNPIKSKSIIRPRILI